MSDTPKTAEDFNRGVGIGSTTTFPSGAPDFKMHVNGDHLKISKALYLLAELKGYLSVHPKPDSPEGQNYAKYVGRCKESMLDLQDVLKRI